MNQNMNQKVFKMFSLRNKDVFYVKYRKQLQTETGSVSGPVLFTCCKMVNSLKSMTWPMCTVNGLS